ncbi:hypothetical protein [Thioalkalivibrio sp. ALJ2]|uniref:PIN-like domain-containing protein n=1 Tax=Thioalkalivibrio sp. ALJ2 TaxID=1261622 RepID=UPI00035FB4BC|nr:hypothetical protein [Thioalkalivibrio sp. ALJ2]
MKFLFDNNLPPALAEALGTLTAAHWQGVHSVVHLRDRFDKSVSDTFYIEKLGSEGDWSIVTHDRFAKGLERQALARANIVVFLLDKSWAQHAFWDKSTNLCRWWPVIVHQAERLSGGAILQVPWKLSGQGRFKQVPIK